MHSRDRFEVRRYLLIRSAGSPSFSADGWRVAFLMDVTGVPQVWSVPVEGGWPDQVTFFPDRVAGVEYAPAGDRLLFAKDEGGNERMQLFLTDSGGAEIDRLTHHPEAIHSFGGWSHDGGTVAFGSNHRHPAYFDVYVQPVGGEARMVLETDGHVTPAGWLPDGSAVIARRFHSNTHADLYLVDAGDGSARHLTPHAGEAMYGSVNVSPDGRRLYLTTDRDRDTRAPAVLDLDSGALTLLEEREWDAEVVALSRDGARLAWTTNVEGYSELTLIEVASGRRLPAPELPPGVIVSLEWSPDGRTLALTHSGPRHPSDIWLVDTETGAARRLTRVARAGIPDESFVAPELLRYPTFDGRQIPAFLYRPPGVTRPPVIVNVHGGPEAQARPGFNPLTQYWLRRGFAVCTPNVRGSTGYGKAYSHLDDVRLRMDSVRDLEYANRWLRASGLVDAERIVVSGGSYGGFMTLAAVTTQPDLWAAGVDTVGIANWLTFLENTGPWRRRLRAVEYGDPETDADFLREISPINHVDKIRAPLMVIHGANDPRVPINEAEQIVAALRERERPVEYLRFEDEGHGVLKLENRVTAYTAVGEFLDRHLTP
jgi:dipeptidyl aminopeptidase/acylaminoacyl peptidase